MITFGLFPGGVQNAVTFSYDDGQVTGDERLMALFRKYGLKGTFHLNNWLYPASSKEEIRQRYEGFEISAHGKEHHSLTILPACAIMEEMLENRTLLESIVRRPVIGMSYAKARFSPEVMDLLRHLGFVYGRTTLNTHDFNLPQDFMAWHPTCHHRTGLTDAKKFVDAIDGYFAAPRLLYVWGHSHELKTEEQWADMEQLCAMVANHPKVWYATNMEIYEYVTAQRNLVIATDQSFAYNPSRVDVWVVKDREPHCIPAGEVYYF
jgi:hypothetical protein